MRDEVWIWLTYFVIAGAILGGIWLHHRHTTARVHEVSERAARLTPAVPAQRHPVDPSRRPVGCTVYWSKEAIKDAIIKEHDSLRTTVMRLRPDPAELARVFNLARRVGQNDHTFDADLILQGHEPDMSRDLDVECYPALSNVTKLRQNTDV